MSELDLQNKKYAEQLLNNPLLNEIFQSLRNGLDDKLISCKSRDEAWDVTKTKQLLAGMEREIRRAISVGNAAEIKLNQIKPNKERIFRR